MSGTGSKAWVLSVQTSQAIKAGRATPLPTVRGAYNTSRGEYAKVRMPDGRVEDIPWDWIDGNIEPIRVSRRKATFCDERANLEAEHRAAAKKLQYSAGSERMKRLNAERGERARLAREENAKNAAGA